MVKEPLTSVKRDEPLWRIVVRTFAEAPRRAKLAVGLLLASGVIALVVQIVCARHGTELKRWKSSCQVFAEPKARRRARASPRGGV